MLLLELAVEFLCILVGLGRFFGSASFEPYSTPTAITPPIRAPQTEPHPPMPLPNPAAIFGTTSFLLSGLDVFGEG